MDLKNCPFCGGKAQVFSDCWPHEVYCAKCQAHVKSLKYSSEGERDAINKWNRRQVDAADVRFTRIMGAIILTTTIVFMLALMVGLAAGITWLVKMF